MEQSKLFKSLIYIYIAAIAGKNRTGMDISNKARNLGLRQKKRYRHTVREEDFNFTSDEEEQWKPSDSDEDDDDDDDEEVDKEEEEVRPQSSEQKDLPDAYVDLTSFKNM